jgi:hypothetical protein
LPNQLAKKGKEISQPDGFCVGSTRFEEKVLPGFKPIQTGTRPKAAGQPKAGLAKPDAAKPRKNQGL